MDFICSLSYISIDNSNFSIILQPGMPLTSIKIFIDLGLNDSEEAIKTEALNVIELMLKFICTYYSETIQAITVSWLPEWYPLWRLD